MRYSSAIFLLFSAVTVTAANIPHPDNRNIPLFFIPNHGQAPSAVRFMAKGSGLTAYFFNGEVDFRAHGAPMRMRFEGAANAQIEGASALPGEVNFLSGPPGQWRTGIPIFGALAYRGLYPGIDMAYGVTGRNLKSEFTVAPGADPRQIRIRYLGAGPASIDPDGALVVPSTTGTLRELPPVAWQTRAGNRVPVQVRFELDSDGTVGFALGLYDASLPLVVDPLLSYSTFLGGSSADAANAIAIDSTGAAYVAGFTESFDLPTLNPAQSATGGGNDAFVAKLSASGSSLIYCTYLGGRGDDRAFGIAIDSTGAAYVTGSTQSTNFPVRNAYQATLAGGKNAFVAKLTPTGNSLAYSTYLGGNGSDSGNSIAVDSTGNAYIAGDTTSTTFPVNAFQKTYRGGQDVFVVKLNAAGSALAYSTYLGGGNSDHGAAIAVDSTGTAYVTGSTTSTDFPTANALQPTIGGGQDAFIARLNTTGSALLFSTFLGGTGGSTGYNEAGQGIAVDAAGNAYVAGVTPSPNFPLLNPAQSSLNGATDAFVVKVSGAGALLYSTYLGGSGMDCANAIAVDANGFAYIAGYTYSTDFPVVSTIQAAGGGVGTTDAFVSKLAPTGNSLIFSTYLGGNDNDTATGLGIDPSGNIYVTGWTLSSNFPILNPYQSQNAGNYGAFVTKYVFNLAPANVNVTPSSGSGSTQTFTFQYSDGNGSNDLSIVGALFNTSTGLSNACAVTYNRVQNTLALFTDSGTLPGTTVTPGAGTAQNSQCILNGGASSVTLSGNVLGLTLALTFQPAFGGSKNIYMQAANPFQTTPWQIEGTWSNPPSISMVVSPASGNSVSQTFAFQYTDSIGAADLTTVAALFNTTPSSVAACMVTYNRPQNSLALATDAGSQPAGTIAPGAGSQQNSQCVLSGAGSSVTFSGNVLSVNIALTFQAPFAGAKNVYMSAVSPNVTVPFTQEGIWSSPPVIAMSVSPASGNATQQTFAIQVSDSTGAADLATVGFLVNSTSTTSAACAITYNRAQNSLALLTDAGALPATTITPGSGSAQNTQCVLSGVSSTVTSAGNVLTVNLALTFQPAFSGAKSLYLQATSPFATLSWTQAGTWTSPPAITLAVSPNSGGGAQQRFAFQFTDSLSTTDLTTIGVLFNSSASPAAACAVIYTRAQNTLALLTDAGAQPASTLNPGAGTTQNSQCTLAGSSSSATVSGNTLTLNLQIAFLPAFAGIKNIYMQAVDPYQTVNWTQEGTWATAASLVMSVTPASGSATQQTFSLQVSDTLGATDLATVGLMVNSSTATNSACAVIYNRAQNTLSLLTDAGAQPGTTLTPGSGTAQNSQCILSGASSNVTTAGNLLTVNLALTFQPAFAGAKNVYTQAANAFQNLAWTLAGTWNSPPVITTVISPSSGGGSQQTFNLQFTDSLGATDLTTVGVMIAASSSPSGACAIVYNRVLNTLALLTDAGAAPAGTITPGSGSQSNSQCTLTGAGSSATVSGNTLTLNASIAFLPAFAGTKNLYVEAANPFQPAVWTLQGTWTTAATLVSSVTPSSGSGTQSVFSVLATDSLGAADLAVVGILLNSTSSTSAACAVIYNRALNTLGLLTDAGATPANTITPGSGTQSNSQCTLTGSGSTVSAAGNSLTVNFNLSFQPAFSGAKNIFTESGNAFQSPVWAQAGTWTSPPPVTMSVTPSSGSGSQQTFALQVSDALGATDLSSVGLLINSTSSAAAACAVIYNRAQNTLALLTDAGASPVSTITPGSGSQQNSQCTLSGAGSSVTAFGNTLTVNVAITLQPSFARAKNVYAEAANPYQSATWQPVGQFIALPSLSVVLKHNGNLTQGQSGATYSITVSNGGIGSTGGAVSLTVTLPTGLSATSIAGSGWTCAQSAGPCSRSDALAQGASYPAVALTLNVATNASSSLVSSASVSGGGSASANATDIATILLSANSIFNAASTPGTPWHNDSAITVGLKFRSDVDGIVSGIRFYKGTGNNGTHIGLLYDGSGSLLAQATFTSETASGWQQVNFSTPVAIIANTTYVAAYFSTSGFAFDPGYLTNGGVDNPPLHALQSGVDGPNGLYRYGLAPQFPNASAGNSNYWADVFFSASSGASAVLAVGMSHTGNFAQGQNGAAYTVTVSDQSGAGASSGSVVVSETLPNGFILSSMAGTGWTCSGNTCSRNDPLASGASYPAIILTMNVASNANSPLSSTVNVSGGGSAPANATDVAIVTSSAPTAISIFSSSAAPAIAWLNGAACTLGLKFRSDAAGSVSGVRFYKGTGNSGTHTGLLYSATGTLLAQATFTSETVSGWQQVSFSAPIAITANTTYVVAYFSTSGFAYDGGFFTSSGVDNPPLHALQSGVDGLNAVYLYGTTPQFPTASAGNANYWTDVVFSPNAVTAPITLSGTSIFSSTAAPAIAWLNSGACTLGLKFRSDAAGSVSGVRFYKGTGNSGTHTGLLYSATGTLLAQATFTSETVSGWQQVSFSAPIAITANTTYVVAYFSTSGFAYDGGFFTSSGVDNPPLHALQSGVDGLNAVYLYGTTPQFPTASASNANYWADVVFVSQAGQM